MKFMYTFKLLAFQVLINIGPVAFIIMRVLYNFYSLHEEFVLVICNIQ